MADTVIEANMTLPHVHGMVVVYIPFLCEVLMEGQQKSAVALYRFRNKPQPPRIDPVTCYRCSKPTAPRSKLCQDCIDELLPK
jgi:hypothetical protein